MNRKAGQFRRLKEDQLSVSVQSPVRSPVTGSQREEKNEKKLLGAEGSTGEEEETWVGFRDRHVV